ncbi:N-acetylmuramoyl-L-alanine amidase [Beijerinckia sp. L45]|uniref:peptidoglycan recognition protein family protein n=1 Tax=Beijerinckia sp. L45 TaxID=1641855 RepID=UPI00131BCF30|nr:N-acetylmuramoyl-L-alanine amidase [Beijerinckia sp. L45]
MIEDSVCVDAVTPSPNHGDRRGRAIDALILHYTGMSSGERALARLRDPASDVSCHYFVWDDGRIAQLVPEARRAWHAGRSFWAGETDMNAVSIGVEIVNQGHDGGCPPYPEAQIAAVITLCQDIFTRHAIPAARVLAHSDIAPGRKIDPGEWFPWERLAAAGVGLWVEPAPIVDGPVLRLGDAGDAVTALQGALARIGYDVPVSGLYCDATATVVSAFQRHWRPARVDGVADESTRRVLEQLTSV